MFVRFAWQVRGFNFLKVVNPPLPIIKVTQESSKWLFTFTENVGRGDGKGLCPRCRQLLPATSQELFGDPNPHYFLKSTAVQMGGVLQHKWEVYCWVLLPSRPGSQEVTAIQMGGVLLYKLEVYCSTFFETSRGWGFRNSACYFIVFGKHRHNRQDGCARAILEVGHEGGQSRRLIFIQWWYWFFWQSLLKNFQPQRQWCIKSCSYGPRRSIHHWCWEGGQSVRGNFSFEQRWWCIKSCPRQSTNLQALNLHLVFHVVTVKKFNTEERPNVPFDYRIALEPQMRPTNAQPLNMFNRSHGLSRCNLLPKHASLNLVKVPHLAAGNVTHAHVFPPLPEEDGNASRVKTTQSENHFWRIWALKAAQDKFWWSIAFALTVSSSFLAWAFAPPETRNRHWHLWSGRVSAMFLGASYDCNP